MKSDTVWLAGSSSLAPSIMHANWRSAQSDRRCDNHKESIRKSNGRLSVTSGKKSIIGLSVPPVAMSVIYLNLELDRPSKETPV